MDNREEKKYPIIEEEESVGIASEPVAAIAYKGSVTDGAVTVPNELGELEWDSYPMFGPKTVGEAIERIEKAEAEKKEPGKWAHSDQMWAQLEEKYPWLR